MLKGGTCRFQFFYSQRAALIDILGAVHVALGPVVGPLGIIAEGVRNWEGFAADSYLTEDLAA